MAEVPLWQRFAHDPRSPEYAGLRAADADRAIVLDALSQAYAEGRLDAEELAERTDATNAARTLGELPPLLRDLVPELTPVVAPGGRPPLTPDAIQRRAVEKWEKQRRDALSGFIVPTLVCWVIWTLVNWPSPHLLHDFPWPVFVMLGTGINLLGTQLRRQDIIDSERRRLERREEKNQAKALERQRRRELEGPDAAQES